jgi:TolB protein
LYSLELATNRVELLASFPQPIEGLRLSHRGDRLAFSCRPESSAREAEEICTIAIDGRDLRRLTTNGVMDTYPSWSPDDSRIAFLSWRGRDLDIYVMDADGSGQRLLYDSGRNDADIDWSGERIVFTRDSQIWSILADGSDPIQITDPPNAGRWGNANLPHGDYDPRASPDGARIVFERLVDVDNPFGGYEILVIDREGHGETPLTGDAWTQGLPGWSHTGRALVWIVAAVDGAGRFDIWTMAADGTDRRDVTPAYFPPTFLCHVAVYSLGDAKLFFAGEWWEP